MAMKTVSVTLAAKVTPFVKAMDEARASTKKLEQESTANMQRLGKGMVSVGKDMSRNVTLPIVGIGAAALTMATGFDSSMTKIQSLVGLSASEVDGMRDSVLSLAGETATAPQELADALFVVTSAGLRGQTALDALEMSAKASAAGLGETGDIARAVAGAVNAYGPDVLAAADATDILTATARAGNFETSELASALGRVLPFAQQAEASFEDVGGAVALLTRTNGSASESITQVQALMRGFVVPTAEAATVLGDLGLTAGDVRESIGENGLVATLQMLDEKLGGNREQLGKMLGSSEAASAAFQILEADAQTIADTFGVTNAAAGMTNEAFEIMSETAGFKMKQAWTDLQTGMIQVGDILIPIVADLAANISDLAGWFSDLDPAMQQIIVGVATLAAAAGPLLVVTGSLMRNLGTLHTAMTKVHGVSPKMARAMGVAAGAMAVYAINAKRSSDESRELAESMERVGRLEGAEQLDALAFALMHASMNGQDMNTVIGDMIEGNDGLATVLIENIEASDSEAAAWLRGKDAVAVLTEAREAEIVAAKALEAQQLAGTGATDGQTEATDSATIASRQLADYLKFQTDRANEAADAHEDAADATDSHKKRQQNLRDVADRANDILQEQIDLLHEQIDAHYSAADATFALHDAEDEFSTSLAEVSDRLAEAGDDMRLQQQIMDDVKRSAGDVADAHVRVAEETANMSGATLTATGKTDLLNESLIASATQAEGKSREAIVQYIAAVNGIPPEKATEILALLDEGKIDEAEAAINETSRTREMSIEVDANTAPATDAINAWISTPRRTYIDAIARVNNIPTLNDAGGWVEKGGIVAELRPEFVNGRLVTSPHQLGSNAHVIGGAETASILAAAKFTPAGVANTGSPAPAQLAEASRQVVFNGGTHITEAVDAGLLFAKANAALAVM